MKNQISVAQAHHITTAMRLRPLQSIDPNCLTQRFGHLRIASKVAIRHFSINGLISAGVIFIAAALIFLSGCATAGGGDAARKPAAETQVKKPATDTTTTLEPQTAPSEGPSSAESHALLPEGAFAGFWTGSLDAGGTLLTLIFNVTFSDGGYTAAMDIPQQNAKDFPATSAQVKGAAIAIRFAPVGAEYRGTLLSDGEHITGIWSQSGMDFTLDLVKGDASLVTRPQDPKRPFPYMEEEVLFVNDKAGVILAGTITYPKGGGVFPAVILVSGSGPQDRNEEIFNHRPFLVLADHLTRKGFAVLRYDDRGTGQSTGDFNAATTIDFAEDALAAINFLSNLSMVDKQNVGVVGHSEGGLIAPMLAASTNLVSFIVLLAGPGLPGEELLLLQNKAIMLASGQTIAQADLANGVNKDIYTILKFEKDLTAAEIRIREYLGKLQLPEGQMEAILIQMLTPWYRTYLFLDPRPILRLVRVPVLALNGGKDLQVTPIENLSAIGKALNEGGNQAVTLKVLDGLNHLFQTAGTGLMDEYGIITETFAPKALEAIADWLLDTVNKRAR